MVDSVEVDAADEAGSEDAEGELTMEVIISG